MTDPAKTKSRTALREWVATALFAALLCVCAPFSVPVGPIPITLATLAVYLIALLRNPKHTFFAVLLYVAIGAVGVPVFSGFTGGFGRIIGVTGGYIAGYPLCAVICSLLAHLSQGRMRHLFRILGMLAGTLILYGIGSVWFMLTTGNDILSTLSLCVLPFLPGDAIKMALAFILALVLEKPLSTVLPTATRPGENEAPEDNK